MRLVEDNRVRSRQKLRHPFLAQHDVSEKKVMVDDHDIRRECLLPCFHDEAFVVMRAIGAEAILARRSHERPDRRVLRDLREVALVAARAVPGEGSDDRQVACIIPGRKTPGMLRALEVVVAYVVRAPLQQRDRHGHFQRLTHDLDIAIEQLVLERLGAGRNDVLAARKQRRNEVCESLPGAGPRFGDQHRVFFDGVGHGARHLDLPLAHAEAPDRLRQRAVAGKYRIEVCQSGCFTYKALEYRTWPLSLPNCRGGNRD